MLVVSVRDRFSCRCAVALMNWNMCADLSFRTGCEAFLEVLGRKQAGYEQVIVWLHKEKTRLEARR
jgi:hypothetical protein